jgi:hypothetical protein
MDCMERIPVADPPIWNTMLQVQRKCCVFMIGIKILRIRDLR